MLQEKRSCEDKIIILKLIKKQIPNSNSYFTSFGIWNSKILNLII